MQRSLASDLFCVISSGAIISTLSRRSKGCVDYLPKYEMITFTKVPCIPTSHVHMYDPDDVDIACAIFKVGSLRVLWAEPPPALSNQSIKDATISN